ncbi:DUF4198 domain-containing protein [Seohaeicola zhoushanensis]|uniref:DUF4198 domain-containing protein n=1 Tax=Seohaeicola zhoushanensis TaxID=1569283 RepID=A0A8J3MAJ2_9RHOB|nr:DUF4198 domain-containing protein [Seohaeicola zhoushanensis]GHF67808.1 hypothetical protein GCM10017056_43730 [Seohaeicola zhoushanensis]
MRIFLAALVLLQSTLQVAAHEYWIEPENFQVESGAPLVADLRNGQQFKGGTLAYFSKQTARFELITRDGITPVEGRMGDIPALHTAAPEDGLLVILYETTASTLKYTKWETFADFTTHKAFPEAQQTHRQRGLPESLFTETYRRFAKALVGVGSAEGADAETGMETEFVALTNPYTEDLSNGMAVRLLYQGQPRADAQVEVFDRAPDKTVTTSTLRTDAQGEALVPVTPGHVYLLDGVVLRPMNEGADFAEDLPVWESLWAAMTFAVPTE